MSRRRKGVFALLLGASLPAVGGVISPPPPPPPPPPSLLAAPFDTRWGTSTDANGWITQNLGAGNRAIYLDTVNGNDANTGLSAAQAKKTFNAAQNLFISFGCQAGDKLLIAEGSVAFDTTSSSLDPVASAGSPGVSNLTCVQSYDPTDPTNAAKWGRVVGANMPVIEINSTTGTGLNIVNTGGVGYVFYQGLEIRCTTNVSAALSAGLGWSTNSHPGMVVQNCRFNGAGLASSSGLGTVTSVTNTPNGGLVSKCSFWNSAGLFVEETDGFRIEEVFGGHGGFDITASREDALINGGASFFSHMFYLHASNTNMQMHRVIVTDATDGLGLRCGGTVTQIVSIDNPVALTAGGKSSDVVAERPDGAPWACDDVVLAGMSKVLQTGSPGGWALEFLNTKIGAYTRNVAAFDFDDYGFDAGFNRYFAGTRLDAAQVPTYMLCDKWSGYRMAVTGESDSGIDLGNYHLSITNSVLDVLPTGLNGTVSGVTTRSVAPPGYKTRSDIYTALGYANKAAWVNAMCFRPDLIGQMAQAICGIALPAMGLTPLYQTASPPSVVVGAPIIYKTAATDLTISKLNFTRGTPSIALLSGITACVTLSCADLPAGFSMAAFRATPSGTCTSGSNQITGVSDTTGVLKGMLVEAKTNAFTNVSLFPAGTVITNIVGSTITCSNNATGNTGGEAIIISSGGRMISYDGSGSGAATPTIHMLETPKDAGMATHTTAFVFNIASGVVGTTWATNADWALSNGSLTALRSGTGAFWAYELTSVPKTNGTADFTIDAMGSAVANYVGFDNGSEISSPGNANSIFWKNNGDLVYGSSIIAALATWTTGDKLRIVKVAGNYTFFKWNGASWVQQGSAIDSTSVTYGLGTIVAGNCYPSLASQNATGFQVTADFSGF